MRSEQKRICAILLALFLVATMPEESVRADDSAFVLAAVAFDVIDGRSKPGPLLAVSGLEVGTSYATAEALETALADARQVLLNRRVFDGIEVSWEPVESTAAPAVRDGADIPSEATPTADTPATAVPAVPVVATFVVDDGWTILPIPFYRYNSNSGHNPFGVLYWDNIAGTLTDFGMSVGYYSRNWVDPFGWDVRLDWRRIRWLDRRWNFGIDQEFTTEELASPDGDVEFAYTGYRTKVSLATGFRLTDALRYSVSPRVDAEYGFDTTVASNQEDAPDSRVGLGFTHSIGAGRVDWHGNLRSGRSWGVSNSLLVDVRDADVVASVGADFRIFRLPLPRINPGFNVDVVHYFQGDKLGQGSKIRGVADNRVYGQTGLFLQNEIGILALDIPRFLDLHVNPFLDLAIVTKEGEPLRDDDFSAGMGIDVVLFPDFIRGFQGRVSVGTDLRDPDHPWYRLANVEFFIIETLSF